METTDAVGRTIVDAAGHSGGGSPRARQAALATRRVTLRRPGAEEVVVVTNLTDAAAYPAEAVMELYARRWGIEQLFQQVRRDVLAPAPDRLRPAGGPAAVLMLPAAVQREAGDPRVRRRGRRRAGGCRLDALALSAAEGFDHARRQLQAWAYHTDGNWPRAGRTPAAMRRRLRELLAGVWDPKLFTKAADKRPRVKPKPKGRLKGGHNSVQRVLDGTAKVIKL